MFNFAESETSIGDLHRAVSETDGNGSLMQQATGDSNPKPQTVAFKVRRVTDLHPNFTAVASYKTNLSIKWVGFKLYLNILHLWECLKTHLAGNF